MKKTAHKTVAADASRTGSKQSNPDSRDNLNLAEIKELIELVSEKQFNEFELERGNFRLRLQKGALRVAAEPGSRAVASSPVEVESRTAAPAVKAAAAAPIPEPASAPATPEEKLHIVTSPIVGTFYRASSPTAEPFVKLGDSVEAGKTLCIIEAMKLMNEIESDASGAVAKIFAENGQPVEYGQPLFGLKM